MHQASTVQEDKMFAFSMGLLFGIVLGRAFEIWVDWKYKK